MGGVGEQVGRRLLRSRSYIFVVNNPTDGDESQVACLLENSKYGIFGREIAPTSGTPHLQGYVVFNNARSFESVRTSFPDGTHIEPAKGSSDQNITYCSKSGNCQEFGTRPLGSAAGGALEKERWKMARLAATEGRLSDIPDDIFIRYYAGIRSIAKDFAIAPPDLDCTTGEWIWGPSGIGKSRFCRDTYPGSYIKLKSKWWDGYQGEETIILDDVDVEDGKWLGYFLKIWMDHYAFRAEIKGGSLFIRPRLFIVTSQYSIEEVFLEQRTVEALRRRCKVTHMHSL